MLRFFEVFIRNQGLRERRLNLAGQGLGNHSIKVVASILKNNEQFAQVVSNISYYQNNRI